MTDKGRAAVPDVVLVLEDNAIILLDTEEMMMDLGVSAVLTATSPREALELVERTPPKFALLDVELGYDTCFAVAERLTGLRIPFAFATGYADNHLIPERFSRVPCLRKPYSIEALEVVLKIKG